MCLVVAVELFGVTPDDASVIAQRCSSTHDLEVHMEQPIRGSAAARFSITDHADGCACSLLGDDADWNAATWKFADGIPTKLANVLRCLLAKARGAVAFEALWIGDEPGETYVSTNELLQLIEADAVGTKTRYVISR